MSQSQPPRSSPINIGKLISYLSVFIGIWLAIPLLFWVVSTPLDKEFLNNVGLLGDAFGTVNSLVSSIGLFFLMAGVLLQHQQLERHRVDAEEARRDLKRQADNMRDAALIPTLSHLIAAKRSFMGTQRNDYEKMLLVDLRAEAAKPSNPYREQLQELIQYEDQLMAAHRRLLEGLAD